MIELAAQSSRLRAIDDDDLRVPRKNFAEISCDVV
jgi:hypothetical protein